MPDMEILVHFVGDMWEAIAIYNDRQTDPIGQNKNYNEVIREVIKFLERQIGEH